MEIISVVQLFGEKESHRGVWIKGSRGGHCNGSIQTMNLPCLKYWSS